MWSVLDVLVGLTVFHGSRFCEFFQALFCLFYFPAASSILHCRNLLNLVVNVDWSTISLTDLPRHRSRSFSIFTRPSLKFAFRRFCRFHLQPFPTLHEISDLPPSFLPRTSAWSNLSRHTTPAILSIPSIYNIRPPPSFRKFSDSSEHSHRSGITDVDAGHEGIYGCWIPDHGHQKVRINETKGCQSYESEWRKGIENGLIRIF
jgi:hypothetical protein